MFMDEMEKIDRATAVDSGFAKVIRATGVNRKSGPPARDEESSTNPVARVRRGDAAYQGDGRGAGFLWWEHGPRWEARRKK